MKNHFYIAYTGNKRNEITVFYQYLNFNNITTIIEPYAGSCAISYYISLQNPKKYKYILNDNNPYLLEMYNIIKSDSKIKKFELEYTKIVKSFNKEKEKYKDYIKNNNNIYSYIIKNKIYSIRPGLFPINNTNYKEEINLKEYGIYNFFRNENITFLNIDAIEVYNKYKNNQKNMIIMDPPYINTNNDFYTDSNMNIYEYLYNHNINNEKATIYLILENIWIIKLLFKDNNKLVEYGKKYETSQKLTTHILISNKN
jgi:hypothetical protein